MRLSVARLLPVLLMAGGVISSCFKKPVRTESKSTNHVTMNQRMTVSGQNAAQHTIVSRGQHACYVRDKRLWCWGKNDALQLGLKDSDMSEAPVEMDAASGSVLLYASSEKATCVWTDKGLWCWGQGQSEAQKLKFDGEIISLQAGEDHFCLLDEKQEIWCWGSNQHGQSGAGQGKRLTHPQKLSDSETPRFTGVAPGYDHSCGISVVGQVYCWGDNHSGQAGLGAKGLIEKPEAIKGLSEVVSVGSGLNHSCALNQTGEVWCWGLNTYGQLGSGEGSRSGLTQVKGLGVIRQLSVGASHSCALDDDKKVSCWGWNLFAQSGDQKSHVTEPVLMFEGLPQTEVLASHYFTLTLDEQRMVRVRGLKSGISSESGDSLKLLDP